MAIWQVFQNFSPLLIRFDFSLVIMWAYFVAYVLMFLVASFISATNAHERKDGSPTIRKAWVAALCRKKKVYRELLLHIFDQATDFAVVYEFATHYESDASWIGIHTQHFFLSSIAIIIIYRVISAVAVYNLTHKPMYAISQSLDVLMIRCVHTNYTMDTTQPSVMQRYLMSMEAIFESAPQLLISTAFLIVTSQTTATISATVLISLFTSLFTLCARVCADDKAVFNDDWKVFKHSRSGKWKFPFVNFKYITRVALWRFLEISSRILLLVLAWLYLGATVIFCVLFVEVCYLTVLAWALGTVDIMGNLVYLRAPTLCGNTYEWVFRMTIVFWIWRVLSAWALLIVISTLHSGGLGLLVYCWVATPLWQWIAAIVMFDYKNVASVKRDLASLVTDGKWDQVLELVSFGVQFNPVLLSQNIGKASLYTFSAITQAPTKPAIATGTVDGKEDIVIDNPWASDVATEGTAVKDPTVEDAAVEDAAVEASGDINCPGGHGLRKRKAGLDGIRCDGCGSHTPVGAREVSYGCKTCNFDLCAHCFHGSRTCPRLHGLKSFITERYGYSCDDCRTTMAAHSTLYGCRICNYDLCENCFNVNHVTANGKVKLPSVDQLAVMCKEQIEQKEKAAANTKGTDRKEDDEVVTCPKHHPLLITNQKDADVCRKCNDGKGERCWHCNQCQYQLCLDCFDKVQQDVAREQFAWMKDREPADDKPILMYGVGCCAIVIGLAFLFGSDLAALSVIGDYDCNIVGGSDYVRFNVVDFLLYGAIVHLSVLGIIICCGCYTLIRDSECTVYATACAVCCALLFNIAWIVIGFLLHSEMTPDNVADDAQCIDMVYSWTIIKAIEFGGIPCLGCCAMLCTYCYDDVDNMEDVMVIVGQCCAVSCALICGLGLFLGSDIALLVIHSKFDCDHAMIGEATYLDPNTWIYGATITHLSVGVLACCCSWLAVNRDDDIYVFAGAICYVCVGLYFLAWAGFGFALHSELDLSTETNKMCGDAILAWSILKIIEYVPLPVCAVCMMII